MARLSRVGTLVLSLAISFGAAELVYSVLYRSGVIEPPSGVFIENPGGTIQFDPVSGYRAPRVPARGIRIDAGRVEWETVVRGNNAGFYDARDFEPSRRDRSTYRVAVLGDSYSSAPYLKANWTDRVESAASAGSGPRLELLNFSLDAVGLANWRNIVVHKVIGEGYDVDLVLFAVFGDDLQRSFRVLELRDRMRLAVADGGWDPSTWPRSDDDLVGRFVEVERYFVLPPPEYDRVVNHGWHPELPREGRFHLTRRLLGQLDLLRRQLLGATSGADEDAASGGSSDRPTSHSETLSPAQRVLVNDIARALSGRRIPVAIVRIPSLEEILDGAPIRQDILQFAQALNAILIDGADAFNGLTPEQKRAEYFQHDGHWNQDGSDRFARAMFPVIESFAAPMMVLARSANSH